jgi:hypothetical protein
MTPMPDTPGLIYWFRERCSHLDRYKELNFFGKLVEDPILPTYGRLIFDLETHELWWLFTSY